MLILTALLAVQPHDDCGSLAGDQEIAQCWVLAAEKAETEMNLLLPDVIKAAQKSDSFFTPDQRRGQPAAADDLQSSQRAWLAFRSAQCAVESDYAQGGSLQNIIAGECMTKMTRDRIRTLHDLATDFEGH